MREIIGGWVSALVNGRIDKWMDREVNRHGWIDEWIEWVDLYATYIHSLQTEVLLNSAH